MRCRLLAVVLVLLAFLASCARGGDDPAVAVRLDGSARTPDVVGLVTAVSLKRVTIGRRSFAVSPRLQGFATASRQPVSLLGRKGQFVHAGVVDDEVVWIASFGPVAQIGDRPPAVLYVGTVKSLPSAREVHFIDGTLLSLDEGVPPPAVGAKVRADLSPESGSITALVAV